MGDPIQWMAGAAQKLPSARDGLRRSTPKNRSDEFSSLLEGLIETEKSPEKVRIDVQAMQSPPQSVEHTVERSRKGAEIKKAEKYHGAISRRITSAKGQTKHSQTAGRVAFLISRLKKGPVVKLAARFRSGKVIKGQKLVSSLSKKVSGKPKFVILQKDRAPIVGQFTRGRKRYVPKAGVFLSSLARPKFKQKKVWKSIKNYFPNHKMVETPLGGNFSKKVVKKEVLASNHKMDNGKILQKSVSYKYVSNKSVSFTKDDEAYVKRNPKAFLEKDVDTVFTRYEKWAKPLELKPHYQNIKNTDGNFKDIVRQFTLLLQKGGGEAKLVLQPEHLGSVKMKIQLRQSEVITSVLVDNQAVKDLILSRLTILEENLLRHGFNLGSFDVDVKGEEADSQLARKEARGEGASSIGSSEPDVQPLESFPEAWLPWISTVVNITV